MAKQIIKIDTIFGGQQPSFHFGEEDQYLTSIAIDPDVPITDASADIKTSGIIRPVAYGEFSSSVLDGVPISFISQPKSTTLYSVQSNGDLVSYTSAFASETLVGTVTGTVANGAVYYNNYIYISTGTDISRYGPLNGSPSLTNTVWTGATLGTQTALTNTTYPTTRHSVKYPNHWMHVHKDNGLYVCDFVNGQGVIHKIKTKKVTDEGDTNDGSAYNVLDLPFGYMPYAIASYGTFLAIAASQTSDTTINQGNSALFLWDTVSSSFSRVVELPDPICSALQYQNGTLYGWSGNLSGGYRLWKYLGGDTVQTIKYIEEGHPPLAGAVTGYGNRVLWGTFTTYPDNSASVLAYGSKSDLFPRGLHNIARSTVTATASNGLITCLKNVQQSSGAFPKFVIGGTDGTNYNLDKQGTTYQTSYWRSPVFRIGKSFKINRIRLSFGQTIGANMTLTPKLYFYNETTSQAGTIINNTNYPNSDTYVYLTSDNFSNSITGRNNFYLELKFTGTALLTVLLPIEIEIETYSDETAA